MIYLASPYSHPDPLVREWRYLAASRTVIAMLHRGEWVYSPIVHCHELAKVWDLPIDIQFWKQYNFAGINACTEFRILQLPGWKASKGITIEFAYAKSIHKPYCFQPWEGGDPYGTEEESA